MPPKSTDGMIDGFSSVQALRRKEEPLTNRPDPAKKPDHASPHAPMGSGGTQPRPVPAAGGATHIGTTALPTRHELVCYECGFSFTITGRLDKVFCSKCRTQLVTESIRIEGNWTQDIKTVGRVEVLPRAVVTDATLIGTDIHISGDVTGASLQPTRRLELAAGAKVTEAALHGQKLLICEGAELRFDAPLECADIEIQGRLRANLHPTGCVTIKPGGCLSGSLQAAHLVVEDGGGLLADIRVTRRPRTPQPKL